MISIPHSPIEAFAFENAKWSFPLFQFLTVRLKLLAFDVTRESSLISIPHSPIEAGYLLLNAIDWKEFQFLTVRLKPAHATGTSMPQSYFNSSQSD